MGAFAAGPVLGALVAVLALAAAAVPKEIPQKAKHWQQEEQAAAFGGRLLRGGPAGRDSRDRRLRWRGGGIGDWLADLAASSSRTKASEPAGRLNSR